MLTLSLLTCALVALSRADDVSKCPVCCPDNWVPFKNHCFRYFDEQMSWVDAQLNCKKNNGNLASIHNLAELHFVNSIVPQNLSFPEGGIWVGGSDCQQEGTWLYNDGSNFEFTFWCPTEPNDKDASQNCLQAAFGDLQCWNDLPCHVTLSSVCRITP